MAMNNFSYPYMPTIPGQFNPSAYMQNIGIQQPTQIPQFNAQMSSQQPINGLTRVTGMDGAKAYQMPPNSVVALFDGNEDIFYIKTSDGAGFSTIKPFKFMPIEESPAPVATTTAEFATKQELASIQKQIEEMKGMIDNGKQSVPEQQPTTANEQNRPRR